MNEAALSGNLLGIALVVLLLGMKHGFDADHLAAIDGMTRYNALARPRLARRTGMLFSLGHGAVVVAVALGASLLARGWQAPQWLESFGAWTSICILTGLGLLNLGMVLRTPARQRVAPVGWRSGLFARVLKAGSPLGVMGVGMLFAISFDTMSQAALMATAATRFGGAAGALLLSLLFVAGMLLTDGIDGLWIARLLRRADRSGAAASRAMAIAVAAVSLGTAGWGVAAQTLPSASAWGEGKALWFGSGIVAFLLLSFAAAMLLARRAKAAST